ncbi:MAG TPA: GTP-binding protein [Kofleriaceae bacterium]|nr:GTP-binding protein [Kofleriaceae bacterium]
MDAVRFTILTGFLGAGKTTTLNRMLAAPHGRRLAVLVNELGRIAIDSRLIVFRGGDVLELAGGCVCCKIDVKNDLWDGIAEVVARSRPEQVVLETTGIAEPDAILDGLDRVPAAVRDRIAPAGVVCVVDAEAGLAQLDRRDEARAQVAAADRVLLRKLDRASAAQLAAVRARVAELNPAAELASFPTDDDGAMAMTGWILEARARPAGHGHPHGHGHGDGDRGDHHAGQLRAAIFADPEPLLGEAVLEVLRGLGDRLVRAKGFIRLAGEDQAGFVERAGTVLELRRGLPWPGPARTELVLIGDDLDEAALRRALWACRVGT